MKISNQLKRIGTFVLSIAMVGAIADGFVGEPLQAASTNKIEFRERVWENETKYTTETTVVAGYSVDVHTTKPDGWVYNIEKPFHFGWTGSDGTSKNLEGKSGVGRIEVKTPLQPEVGNNVDRQIYSVTPNLFVQVSEGKNSTMTYLDSGRRVTVAVDVKSPKVYSITANNSISFKTSMGQIGTNVNFDPVHATSGTWNPLYMGANVVTTSSVVTTNGKSTFKVSVSPNNPSTEHQVLEFEVTVHSDSIPAGAEIKLNYMMETIGEIMLEAVSPKAALDNTTDELRNPTSTPTKTGRKKAYVEFTNKGDAMYAVSKDFFLLQKFYKYNALMKIDWKAEGIANDYLEMGTQANGDQMHVRLKSLPENDVTIELTGEIGFAPMSDMIVPTDTKQVKLQMTIMGTGVRPLVKLAQQTIGINDPSDPTAASNGQVLYKTPITNNRFPSAMGVYDGSTPHSATPAEQKKWAPYAVQANLSFGSAQGRATSAKISATSTDGGQVEFRQGASPNGTVLSATGLVVQSGSAGRVPYTLEGHFIGKKEGTVVLKIEFSNASGPISPAVQYSVKIEDHTPKNDATLKQVEARVTYDPAATASQIEKFNDLYGAKGILEFGFSPDQNSYDITVPDVVDTINLRPIYEKLSAWGANQDITISVVPSPNPPITSPIKNGDWSGAISLVREGTTKITLNTKAEDGSQMTYIFGVTRSSKNMDGTLNDIVVTRTDAGNKNRVELTPKFSPAVLEYSATVPYAVDKLNIKAIANDAWASRPQIESDGPATNFFLRMFENASNKDIILRYDVIDPATQQVENVTNVSITVTPEDTTMAPQVYKIKITREKANNDTRLSSLSLFRNVESEAVKLQGKGFDKESRIFYATVPYSTEQLQMELLPESQSALQVRVEASAGQNNNQTKQYVQKDTPIRFIFPGLKQGATSNPALDQITYKIWVTAESGSETSQPYELIVSRDPPDQNTDLTSLTIQNEADGTPIPKFAWIQTKRVYDIDVDYTVDAVIVTPVAKSKLSKVFVDGKLINTNVTSHTVKLIVGGVTKIVVSVVPESGAANTGTHVINITRKAPSNEARLINLVVNGGTDQKPTPFVPSTTSYSWSIPEGTKDFTVTATPVDATSIITVNGKVAPNGGPSEKIVTSEANTTVQVVVTAQNGKTAKTYTLKITNYNYIKKSTNADLSSLKLNHGQLAPAFNPTVQEYEVYVEPTAMYLAITPRSANSKATIEVKQGNRVVSHLNGVYTSSLLEDETTFVITVTPEDTKIPKKTYTLYVYRNDEEKMGIFAPITPEMVDFESTDPIIIDIATYPVVDALVFNTLKTEYPDKTILFKGNDYTLELKGSDMDTLVPHTAEFDLSFSFSTPEQTAIENLLYDMGSNNRIEPVYVHFNHQGTLPAPMLLTVSLGREYSNEAIYWNYYNKERSRIDYYGYVNTNAKGTFSVPIEHFGTFFTTEDIVRGAENKSGLDYSSVPWMEDMAISSPTQKVNPNTGNGDGCETASLGAGRIR